MPRLSSFFSVSLDGFFADERGSVDWSHDPNRDPEWNAFVSGNASATRPARMLAMVFAEKGVARRHPA